MTDFFVDFFWVVKKRLIYLFVCAVLYFWEDSLHASWLWLGMNDCSFTQRILNIAIEVMYNLECYLVVTWLVPHEPVLPSRHMFCIHHTTKQRDAQTWHSGRWGQYEYQIRPSSYILCIVISVFAAKKKVLHIFSFISLVMLNYFMYMK